MITTKVWSHIKDTLIGLGGLVAVISGISTKQESTSMHYLGDIIHSTINLIGTVS